MMVVKENADVDMDVHLDKFFLSFSALFASNFFFFFFFTSRSRQVLFFSLHMLVLFERFFYAQSHLRSNKMTNISLRTTQTRTHTYIYTIVLCVVRVRFFLMLIRSFFLLLQSLSLSLPLALFPLSSLRLYVCVSTHTCIIKRIYRRVRARERDRERKKNIRMRREQRLVVSAFLLGIE